MPPGHVKSWDTRRAGQAQCSSSSGSATELPCGLSPRGRPQPAPAGSAQAEGPAWGRTDEPGRKGACLGGGGWHPPAATPRGGGSQGHQLLFVPESRAEDVAPGPRTGPEGAGHLRFLVGVLRSLPGTWVRTRTRATWRPRKGPRWSPRGRGFLSVRFHLLVDSRTVWPTVTAAAAPLRLAAAGRESPRSDTPPRASCLPAVTAQRWVPGALVGECGAEWQLWWWRHPVWVPLGRSPTVVGLPVHPRTRRGLPQGCGMAERTTPHHGQGRRTCRATRCRPLELRVTQGPWPADLAVTREGVALACAV